MKIGVPTSDPSLEPSATCSGVAGLARGRETYDRPVSRTSLDSASPVRRSSALGRFELPGNPRTAVPPRDAPVAAIASR
jgi:hypothetical protein